MPLAITIDYDSGVPVYRQIRAAILQALGVGKLRAGERLPTIHELARSLEINPNTVARAYRELEHSGHLVAKQGIGTFPAATAPRPASSREKRIALQRICNRAIAEAAQHSITVEDLVDYLRSK